MSTRSRIGYVNDKGQYMTAYCHWDGYPEYNGKILYNHYKDIDKIKKLVDGGSISSLHGTPDVGRYGEEPIVFPDFSSMIEFMNRSDQEYLYIYENGEWVFYSIHNMNHKFEYMGTLEDYFKENADV